MSVKVDEPAQTVLEISRFDPEGSDGGVSRFRRTFAATSSDWDVWFGIIVSDSGPPCAGRSHGAGMTLSALEVRRLHSFLGAWLETAPVPVVSGWPGAEVRAECRGRRAC